MQEYKKDFIEFLYRNGALLFGDFVLKSGRKSPYFFNMGMFNSGASLVQLGKFYAEAVQNSGFKYDILFGPAYKGIPLVCATAAGLYSLYGLDIPYCFNRKEKKSHGDKGEFVGAPLQGNVVMVDDVITAGTTVRDTVAILENLPVKMRGILIAFDRQERGSGEYSALEEVFQQYQIPVVSIVNLQDVLEYLGQKPDLKTWIPAIESYQSQYGVLSKK